MPGAGACRTGWRSSAIRATRRSIPSTGSSASRSWKPATTCSATCAVTPRHTDRRRSSPCRLPGSVDEIDLDSLVDQFRQGLSVPIGEADASVRLGLADVLRLRGAVDAVAVAEIDPGTANRIVGTGGDGEGLFRLHALEVELGRVVIGRVLDDGTNGQRTAGSGPLLAADRRRIKADQLALAVQRANGAVGFVHHDFCDLRLRWLLRR